ncbi:hypothetical protein ZWY2020_008785 [Hordeum vulgare]|nr:hypothetical protein ZWY2020_008785 [Hordeum vulgare]
MENDHGDGDDLGSGWFEVKRNIDPARNSHCRGLQEVPSIKLQTLHHGLRPTTVVAVQGGACNLKNGFSVSALEHVVQKCEELQLAEDTNDNSKLAWFSKDRAQRRWPNSSVKFGNFDEVPGLALPSDAFRDNNSSTKYMDDEDATQFRNELKDETKLEDEMNSIRNSDTSLIHAVEAPTECKRNPLDICEIQDSLVVVSGSTTLADSVSLSSNNDLELPVTSSSVASIESQSLLCNHTTVSVDLGGETAESKERFRQRLWCFLFENLNRAVDELYLLCELECDMEQINESILVLDEAISDFQELKSRAEHFDNTKKSPSLPKEGMPMAVKADHRRPHALSWEVRRMTSSPHRQEILSSSLEAFQRIQFELARKQAGITGESFASSSSGKFQVAKRAGDESTKVSEVRFITSLNDETKKFLLRQKLHDSEMRRAEKLQVIKTKQKEDTAREEAVLERRKFLEAEKMQRLAEIQRKKEEAIVRREEERKHLVLHEKRRAQSNNEEKR